MSKFLTGVVPADFDPDAIEFRHIGEFLVDKVSVDQDGNPAPTAYIALINPKTGKKQSYLIGGSGKYELIEHLARAHVIGNTTPTNFDRSTIWFNSELVYVEPADVTKAFFSIRVEESPGQWKWQKIIPYTTMDTVILGKDDNGLPITLASVVKDNRIVTPLSTQMREASYGEIYINDRDELYYKNGPDPQDQHLVGTVNGYLRERLIELIKVGNKQPLNFNYNSVWFTDDGDISLSMGKYINFVDPSKSTGLKFQRDAQNKMKGSSTLENENKSVVIDNNSSTAYGHIWTNYAFNENGKYYLEFFIEDKEEVGQIMFLGEGVQQPAINDYGTQVDGSTALITTEKSMFMGAVTTKTFKFNKKTIFIEVTKLDNSCSINLGYVTDSGTKVYVHGDGTTPAFTMNLSRIAVGANTSTVANSYTRFSILPYLIKNIPDGFTAINNTLPGETPFTSYALATNAESVFLAKNVKLADQVESGRIIPVFRDFTDRQNSRVNEVILDSDRGMLYTKLRNGSVVPIIGKWDETFVDHIQNSLKVVDDDVRSLTRLDSDPRRIYITRKPELPTTPDNLITGNMAVVDNSIEGQDKKYKLVLPRTNTPLVTHTWNDGIRPHTDNLKVYLDELDGLVRGALAKDNVYSGYGELNFRKSDLINTFNTQQSFVQELAKRMLDNSLYMESVEQLPAGGVSSNQIDNFFNVPESGILYTYTDTKDNVHSTLLTRNNIYYKTFYKPSYNGNQKWRKIIMDFNGTTNVDKLIADDKMIGNKEIESKEGMLAPILKLIGSSSSITANSNTITNNTANLIKYSGSSILDTLEYEIGDKKFSKAKVVSKLRPLWLDEEGNEYPWMTTSDIRNAWNFKGKLFNSGSYTDLNSLLDPTNNGYYVSPVLTVDGYNHPKASEKGLLHNYQISNDLNMQLFFGKESDGHRGYIRTYDGTKWSTWSTLVNDKDLATKLDLTGGTISGNLEVVEKLSAKNVVGVNIITGRIASYSNYNVLTSGDLGGEQAVVIGDGNYRQIVIVNDGVERPKYYNGTKYQNIIVEDDLEALKLALANDYYNRKQVDKFLKAKVDGVTYTEDMKNKVSRNGDTMLGTLTMTAGDIEINNGMLNISESSKISLPGKNYENPLAFNSVNINKYNNTLRYDVVNVSGDNDLAVATLSSGKDVSVNTNTPTSIQLSLDKNGEFSVNAVLNKAVKTNSRTVLMKDEIINSYSGGTNKVLSAEKGKELNNATVGKSRGNLFDTIGVGAIYNSINLTSLQAGYYFVTTNNEIKSLGLNEDVIKNNNGILIVEGESSIEDRSYRYITKTNQSDQFVLGIRTLTNGTGDWKYIYDISAYYTRAEIDALLKALENKIVGMFRSSRFSFTGNQTNNSIPEKLVHTHNHEMLGDSDTLYFKTNITATTTEESKNFVIRLKGFAMGSASNETSSPIEAYISGRIESAGSGLPTLKNLGIINMIPGSAITVGNVKITIDGFLTFSVKDKVSNRQLSFDTYMRFSSISDTNFQGEISLYRSTAIQ